MYIFIVNPTAGNGRGEKVFAQIEQSDLYQQLETEVYVTTHQGHAQKMMETLKSHPNLESIKAVIVVGGDGTMHEVANGLFTDLIPISFIPAGSGSDFYRGAHLPKKPLHILRNIIERKQDKPYWVAQSNTYEGKRAFVNCIGFGFDAFVVQRANRSPLKKVLNKLGIGRLIYVFALLHELMFYKHFKVTVKTAETTKTFEKCFLLTVNNQPYFGGGMKINPTAENNPDYHSILVVDSISKWKVLCLFLTVFIGKHIYFKEVEIYHTKELIIETDDRILYQIDGEIGKANRFSIKKQPFPLRVKGSV